MTWSNFYQHTIPTIFHNLVPVWTWVSFTKNPVMWLVSLASSRSVLGCIVPTLAILVDLMWLAQCSKPPISEWLKNHLFMVIWVILVVLFYPDDAKKLVFWRLGAPHGFDRAARPCHWKLPTASPSWRSAAVATAWQSPGRTARRWRRCWMAALLSWEWLAWNLVEEGLSMAMGVPQHRWFIDVYLVGGLEHFLFSHILGIIIPID